MESNALPTELTDPRRETLLRPLFFLFLWLGFKKLKYLYINPKTPPPSLFFFLFLKHIDHPVVRSGTFIARTHLHINVNKKKKSASSSSFASSSCFCYSFGAVVYIRRARIARDPRDATVAFRRRRCSRTTISFSFSRTTGNNWWTRKREGEASKKNHTFAKRKRKTDRRRDPRDATLATPPETSERCVRVGTPRRLNARTRGNVCAFFRECILLYTRRFGFADENEFLFSSSLSLSQNNRKKNSPA